MLAGCNWEAQSPKSLVGATVLPSAEVLSKETIYITRGGSPDGGDDSLTYEWLPDGSLTITLTFTDYRLFKTVKGRETLRVAPPVAAQARQLFWRLRPAKLEGLEQWPARPIGCERQGPHDFGEIAIGFIHEGPKPGIDDDEVGLVELPTPQSCSTLAAAEARVVFREALALLPKSKVAAEFERSQ